MKYGSIMQAGGKALGSADNSFIGNAAKQGFVICLHKSISALGHDLAQRDEVRARSG